MPTVRPRGPGYYGRCECGFQAGAGGGDRGPPVAKAVIERAPEAAGGIDPGQSSWAIPVPTCLPLDFTCKTARTELRHLLPRRGNALAGRPCPAPICPINPTFG